MNTKLKFIVLFILWAIAFVPIYPELFHMWFNRPNNSHGLLVPLISAYLIWKKRDELRQAQITNTKWGLVILICSMTLYILSYAGAVAVVARAMIVFSLIGLVLFTFGNRIFAIIKFPLLYLIFMVPVPDTIYNLVAFPLQLFATKVSTYNMQVHT